MISNKQISKGKKIVIFLTIINNIYNWISFLMNLSIDHIQILLKQILGVMTIAIISFLFYKGFKVAEWLTFMLLIEPIMTINFYPLHIIGILELYDGWLMLILAILVGIIGAIIIESDNSISEFLKYQRSKRK